MRYQVVSKLAAVSFAAILICGLSGCIGLAVIGAQQLAMPGAEEDERLEKMVVDGVTTKWELIDTLGMPLHEMNEGHVLIFGGRSRPRGLVHLLSEDKRDEHRLIAVVDNTGVMRDHLWVGKKKPARREALLPG